MAYHDAARREGAAHWSAQDDRHQPQADDQARRQPGAIGTWTNLAAAMVSVGLVIGVAVWGYKLLMRDVTGVPVVQASSAPMRIAPDNPGGDTARHQGLAVNKVAAVGAAADPADRLTLAPRPVDLAAEDQPVAVLAALQRALPDEGDATPAPAALAAADTVPETGGEADDAEAAQVAKVRELAEKIASGAVAAEADAEAETEAGAQVQLSAATVQQIRAIKGGIAHSLRPRKRPQALKVSAPAPRATAPQPVDPESLPAGTWLAQLGAFESVEVAEKEWTRLSARFADYLGDKRRVIQRARSGGRTFYRLRALGFADVDDSRRFCSALVAERADCIPVVIR